MNQSKAKSEIIVATESLRPSVPRSLRLAVLLIAACVPALAAAADLDEFRPKRTETFEFAAPPTVTALDGDRVRIDFATTADCDVTVAIEDAAGRIVRHLASGVLGPNAPAPFAKNAQKQSLDWDGKTDQGVYVDDRAGVTVRVSLGLRPRFEKALFHSHHKRIGEAVELLHAAPEGVYVFDARGVDQLRLFDHDGNYLRTVYPFPADKLDGVRGLTRREFPQSGKTLPVKNSLYQQSLLSSGDNASLDDRGGMTGRAATAMAIRDGRIALVGMKLNRLATDGTTGGLELTGPDAALEFDNFRVQYKGETVRISPTSAAFSPDGQWVYLTGYAYRFRMNFHCLSGVYRLPWSEDGPLELFAGGRTVTDFGAGDKELKVSTSVDCDAQGRVYVTDFAADRVKVFSPEGTLLKTIETYKPAQIRVNRQTGELHVFSWLVCNDFLFRKNAKEQEEHPTLIPAKLTTFGPFDRPEKLREQALPIPEFKGRYGTYTGVEHALLYHGEIDFWTNPPTVWLSRDCVQNVERGVHPGDGGRRTPWEKAGLWLLRPDAEGKLQIVRDFGADVAQDPTVIRARPPSNAIQQMIVNPVTGRLYVGEADSGATVKAFKELVEVDPETRAAKLIETPFNALEGAFDYDGQLYLRTTNVVVRYAFPSWREIPFDYGEELPQVGAGMFGRYSKSMAGLVMPAASPVCFHPGGFHVSPKGYVVASCAYRYSGPEREGEMKIRLNVGGGGDALYGEAYAPRVFPGREFSSTGAAIHVWDRHGQKVYEDAIPGCPQLDGIGMDADDNVYVMATPTRVHDGVKHFNEMSETVMRFKPTKNRILSSSKSAPVPLSDDLRPKRPADLSKSGMGNTWVEGADWFYGGVGFAGFNASRAGGGCACWFSRFALDGFGRSIAPEVLHFSVAIVDSAGNLIVRVGRYGNADSAGPDSPVPLGGDEVGLVHACYVGTHTDRRVFVSDVGNGRVVSVKLDYHATARASVPPRKTPRDVPAGVAPNAGESSR